MLAGGEQPEYIARRMTRMAVEDIGLADPRALPTCIAAWEAFERLGSPEGELALAQAVIYLATAPKSNTTLAFFDALDLPGKQGKIAAKIVNRPIAVPNRRWPCSKNRSQGPVSQVRQG